MKALLTIALLVVLAAPAYAYDTYVNGYYRSNGTYVQPYHRSSPDYTPSNNYSTYGNTNPYTGQAGYVHPTPTYSAPAYVQQPTNFGGTGYRRNSYGGIGY